MPLINLFTSSPFIENPDQLLQNLSSEVAHLTGKPQKFVMAILQTDLKIFFDGNQDPACYVEINSIGSLDPNKMSQVITESLSKDLELPQNRIYIRFDDVSPELWSWNGKTFG